MDEARLTAGVLVSALIRRIEAEGGTAMVVAKGDATAGAILLLLADRGETTGVIERVLGRDGYRWGESGPADPGERTAYLAERRRTDPDLWIVELDHRRARDLALETLG